MNMKAKFYYSTYVLKDNVRAFTSTQNEFISVSQVIINEESLLC